MNNEEKKYKVSVLLPCHNGEKHMHRMLDSLLMQTYTDFRLIFINDGSTDRTEEEARAYQELFKRRSIGFTLLYQRHMGQAAAINNGLPYADGEFFMWVDDDDLLEKEHIEKKVRYLESNKDKDLVACRGRKYHESNMGRNSGKLGGRPAGSLFEEMLFERFPCSNGLYMIRTDAFREAVPSGKIHVSKAGQNMQILLPVALRDKNGFIADELFYYVARDDSHSHCYKNGIEWKKRWDDLEEMKKAVLSVLKISDRYRQRLIEILEIQMCNMRMRKTDLGIMEEQPDYVRETVQNYIHHSGIREQLNGRKIYLWGICPETQNISDAIGRFTGLEVAGYIDSDAEKVEAYRGNREVRTGDGIDSSQMYLIIPLLYHKNIETLLHEKGFVDKKDYFYPEYEIQSKIEE